MKKSQTKIVEAQTAEVAIRTINQDLALAILIVSLVVNLFILTGWIALKVTSAYDSEVATFLFTR